MTQSNLESVLKSAGNPAQLLRNSKIGAYVAPVFAGMDQLLIGAWDTVKPSAAAMAIGLVVSILCAVAKTSGRVWSKVVRRFLRAGW